MPVSGYDLITLVVRVDLREKMRGIDKQGKIVHQHQFFFRCQFPDEGIDFFRYPCYRLRRKWRGSAGGDRRNGGNQDRWRFSRSCTKFPEKPYDLFHVGVILFGRCVVVIGTDIVRTQLEADIVGETVSQCPFVFLEETKVFPRVIAALALVQNFGADAVCFENPPQELRVPDFCDAVAGTKDDVIIWRRGAGKQQNNQDKHSILMFHSNCILAYREENGNLDTPPIGKFYENEPTLHLVDARIILPLVVVYPEVKDRTGSELVTEKKAGVKILVIVVVIRNQADG